MLVLIHSPVPGTAGSSVSGLGRPRGLLFQRGQRHHRPVEHDGDHRAHFHGGGIRRGQHLRHFQEADGISIKGNRLGQRQPGRAARAGVNGDGVAGGALQRLGGLELQRGGVGPRKTA